MGIAAGYEDYSYAGATRSGNVTNVYPAKTSLLAPYEDRGDGLQYSSLSPFGFSGRYVYAKAKADFRF
ncbi:MAG: hypothetical protein QM741_18485 [Rudaea sp.]|uniref:hypothetical protein n=1 Tax=Rudaea sp. TaxID=2136325 RepID=UPI0039E4BB91